uniref:F-box domain-containing protein n=1 Tax=Leersia perrieri TaxID=77586 RepID=A0A0D9XCP8_9ORYZ
MARQKDKTRKATAKMPKGSLSPMTTLGDLPDKLIELILLHLTSPLWLVRAAATCKRWRCVISTTNFICHIDRLLRQLVGGYYNYPRSLSSARPNSSSLAFVPSSSAVALGVDSRRHFSLDFLPGGSLSWEIIDSNGSLILLAKTSSTRRGHRRSFFPNLVVCELVTRRYRLIPRMEEMKYQHCLGVFLHEYNTCVIDMWGRANDNMSRYRVIVVYMEYNGVCDGLGTVRACVYNPNWSSRWYGSWRQRSHLTSWYRVKPSRNMAKCGIYLWGSDSCWAEFEVLRIPDIVRESGLRAIVDGSGGDNDGELRVKSIQLEMATVGIEGFKEGYFGNGALKVITASVGSVVLASVEETAWMFSVDLETMEAAKCKNIHRNSLKWF